MVPTMGGTNPMNPSLSLSPTEFTQYGDMEGAGISVLIDGLTEDGYACQMLNYLVHLLGLNQL